MKLTRGVLYLFTILCTLALAPALWSQQSTNSKPSLHTFWKVEGKGMTMYLLGSVHVLKADDYPLPSLMDAAFTNSSILVFETDISALSDPQVQTKIMSKTQLPPGETLAEQLSDPVYASFTNHVKSIGLPPTMLDQFKPSLAAISLASMEILRLGLSPEYGVDKHYFDRGRKAGKRVIPLETVDFQVDLVTDFTKEEGELLLKTTLEEIDTMKKELSTLVQAWKTGDTSKLEKLLNEASKQAPVIYKRMVTDRSKRWVSKLEELLKGKEGTLVVVGAGHLVGPDGVPELLKKNGWKVTQL